MNVRNNFKKIVFKQEYFSIIIGLTLSLGMIGFAPSSILLGVFIGVSVLNFVLKSKRMEFEFGLFLPILLYGVFVMSYYWTYDIDLTIKGLGRTVSLALVPLSFMIIPKFNRKNIDLIFNIFAKSNLLFAFFFIVNSSLKYFEYGDSSVFIYHNLVSILDLNAIYVSVFYLISFVYLLEKKNKNNIDLFSAVVFLGMILLLSSKTIIFCLILLIFTHLMFFKTKKENLKKSKKIVLIVVIVIVSTSNFVIKRFLNEMDSNLIEVLNVEKVSHTYAWTGTTIRVLQLRFLKEQVYESKIFLNGFGLFASRESLKQKHIQLGTYPTYHEYNYHNMYAQMFSELGIIGLIILLSMLILNLYKSIKNKSFLFFSFSLIMIIWFISESVLWVQKGLFFFIIIQSLLYRTTFVSKEF